MNAVSNRKSQFVGFLKGIAVISIFLMIGAGFVSLKTANAATECNTLLLPAGNPEPIQGDSLCQNNSAPIFTPVPDQTVTVGSTVHFTVDASDPDGDTVIIEIESLPLGAQASNSTGSGLIVSWTPGNADVGIYNASFSATDGSTTTLLTVAITVMAPPLVIAPPVIVDFNPPTTATESVLYTYDVEATDPQGLLLSFSLKDFPNGMTIDSVSGVIKWTPDITQGTTTPYQVDVRVTNGSATTSASWQIVVADTLPSHNSAPIFTPVPDQTVTVGSTVHFTVDASDPDGDTVIINGVSIPLGAQLAEGTTSGLIFTWMPTINNIGTTSVIFEATDGTHTSILTVMITVIEAAHNSAPVFIPVGNQTVVVGSTLSFLVIASDPDNDEVFIQALQLPQGAAFSLATTSSSSGTFVWTPSASDIGTTSATFEATDGTATTSLVVHITVNQAPSGGGGGGILPPVIVDFNPPTTATESVLYTYDVEATDPQNLPLTFTLGTFPNGMTINATSGMILWTPDTTQGTSTPYTVTVHASNGSATTSASWQIVVADTLPSHNSAPIFTPVPDQTVTVGSTLNFTVEATDPDNNFVVVSAISLPQGAAFSLATTSSSSGTFVWTPSASDIGTTSATFEATDGTATTSLVVHITVNQAPSGGGGPTVTIISSGGGGGGGNPFPSLFISNERVLLVSNNEATIVWDTNRPVPGRIVYDTIPHGTLRPDENFGYAFSTVLDTQHVSNHISDITNLLPNTTYYFRAVAHDTFNPSFVVSTQEFTFTTLGEPVVQTPSTPSTAPLAPLQPGPSVLGALTEPVREPSEAQEQKTPTVAPAPSFWEGMVGAIGLAFTNLWDLILGIISQCWFLALLGILLLIVALILLAHVKYVYNQIHRDQNPRSSQAPQGPEESDFLNLSE